MKGKGALEPLSQALAVVVTSRSLGGLVVAHLPTEANTIADALSRQHEPGNTKAWPFAPNQDRLQEDVPVCPRELWGWIE